MSARAKTLDEVEALIDSHVELIKQHASECHRICEYALEREYNAAASALSRLLVDIHLLRRRPASERERGRGK